MQSLFKSLVILCLFVLAGCAVTPNEIKYYEELGPFHHQTPTNQLLRELPHLDNEIMTIAVYSFTDKTGQRKPSQKFSQLSTAVSQGPEVWVIQALKEAGDGTWFKVVERGGLDNLVKERQLIRSTRDLYDGEQEIGNILKPLLFAGLLIEGGVVGYDSNIQSGGVGARYFGIGTSEQYRVDQVTVSMRIVSVQTGEILLSTNVTKTVASHSKGGDVFKFLDMGTKALELETGVAVNEPVNYAIRTAIEFAVLQLVHEGEKQGFWKFKIPDVEIHPHKITNTEKNGVHK